MPSVTLLYPPKPALIIRFNYHCNLSAIRRPRPTGGRAVRRTTCGDNFCGARMEPAGGLPLPLSPLSLPLSLSVSLRRTGSSVFTANQPRRRQRRSLPLSLSLLFGFFNLLGRTHTSLMSCSASKRNKLLRVLYQC